MSEQISTTALYSEKDSDNNRFSLESLKAFAGNFKCVILVIAFFTVWEIVPRTGIVSPLLLPSFSQVIGSLFKIISTGQLFVDLAASLKRSLFGFFLAVFVGIPLGFLTGWYKNFEQYTDLLSQCFRNTSTFALMPIFLLFFGLGETSKVAIVFWGSVWGILINTTSGVKTIDPIYVKAAKSLGLSDFDMFVKVILPACVPAIVSGMRVSAKTAFMVIIAAEMMGAKSGIGFYIQNAQYNFMIPQMYAGILVLSVLGVTLNYSLILLEKKTTSWRGEIDSAIIG